MDSQAQGGDDVTGGIGGDVAALTQALWSAAPLNRTLGLEVLSVAPVVRLRLPNDEPVRNHVGGPHAGAIFTLGESTAATAMMVHLGHLLDRGVALAVRGEIEYAKVARCAVIGQATMEAEPAEVEARFLAGERPEWVTRIDFTREDDGEPCGTMRVTLTLAHPRS